MPLPQPVTGATDNPNVGQPPPVPQTPATQQQPQNPTPPANTQPNGPAQQPPQGQPPQQAPTTSATPPPAQPQQQDPFVAAGFQIVGKAPQQDPFEQAGFQLVGKVSDQEQPTVLDNLINANPDMYRKMANAIPQPSAASPLTAYTEPMRAMLNGIANLKEIKQDPSKEITPEGAGMLAMLFGIPAGAEAGAEGAAGAVANAAPHIAQAGEDMMGAMGGKPAIVNTAPSTAAQQMSQAFGQAGEEATTGQEPILSKTAGESTQIQQLQKGEENAKANIAGPQAKAQADAFALQRNNELKQLPGLAQSTEGGLPQTGTGKIADIVRTNAENDNAAIDNQYEVAKNSADGAGITKDNMKGIVPEPDQHGFIDLPVGNGKAPVTINPETTKGAFQQYTKLKDIIGDKTEQGEDAQGLSPEEQQMANNLKADNGEDKQPETLLKPLQIWRQQTTNLAKSNAGTPDGFALRALVRTYDDHMDNLASTLPDQGSEGIQAFKQAVSLRRDYGQKYEGNKLVQDMVDGDKSIDDITKDALGSGTIKSKKELENTYDATLNAAGERSDEVAASWKQALGQKLYNSATNKSGLVANTNTPAISTAKLETEINVLVKSQPEFSKKVLGQQDFNTLQSASNDLKTINSKQKGVVNPSGSGYAEPILKIAQKLATSKIPYIGGIVDSLKQSVQNIQKGQEAQQSFSGQLPKGLLTSIKPQDAKGGP